MNSVAGYLVPQIEQAFRDGSVMCTCRCSGIWQVKRIGRTIAARAPITREVAGIQLARYPAKPSVARTSASTFSASNAE